MKDSWKKRIIGLLLAVFILLDTSGVNYVYAQVELKEDSVEQSGESEEGNQEERPRQDGNELWICVRSSSRYGRKYESIRQGFKRG